MIPIVLDCWWDARFRSLVALAGRRAAARAVVAVASPSPAASPGRAKRPPTAPGAAVRGDDGEAAAVTAEQEGAQVMCRTSIVPYGSRIFAFMLIDLQVHPLIRTHVARLSALWAVAICLVIFTPLFHLAHHKHLYSW